MKKIIYLSCVGIFSLAACASAGDKPIKKPLTLQFDEQAHRGGRGLMPENTIEAMKSAIDFDVNTLELDLQITADGKVLVSHDPYFNGIFSTTPEGDSIAYTDRSRLLYTMTYDSIQKYDVGQRPHPDFPQQAKMPAKKPLLADLLKASEEYATLKGKSMFYNIEIKSSLKRETDKHHPPVADFVDMAMAVINASGAADRVTLQTFDARALKVIHEKYPAITSSFLIDKKEKRTLTQLGEDFGFLPDVLSPHYAMVTPEMVKECHDKGVKVIVWTANDVESIVKMKELGVDGIITDYPNLFKEAK